VEDGCSWLRVLPADNAQQCTTLRLGRPLVDHDCRFTFALMNSARPAEDADEFQTIKFRYAMVTPLNFHARYRPAMTVSRQSVELARAAVGAVAVDELASVNRPVRVDHLQPSSTAIGAQMLAKQHGVNVT